MKFSTILATLASTAGLASALHQTSARSPAGHGLAVTAAHERRGIAAHVDTGKGRCPLVARPGQDQHRVHHRALLRREVVDVIQGHMKHIQPDQDVRVSDVKGGTVIFFFVRTGVIVLHLSRLRCLDERNLERTTAAQTAKMEECTKVLVSGFKKTHADRVLGFIRTDMQNSKDGKGKGKGKAVEWEESSSSSTPEMTACAYASPSEAAGQYRYTFTLGSGQDQPRVSSSDT